MSLSIALQSVVFYVVSCTPCLQAKHHAQSKAEAKRDRLDKARLQEKNPEMYQHPDPFNTNPYWHEEIMMGPTLPSRKHPPSSTSKNTSQRGLTSSGKDTVASASATENVSASVGSSPTVVPDTETFSLNTSISDDWNRKRYQREDEELWGHEWSRTGSRFMDAIKHAGSSAGRRIEASLGKEPKEITDRDRHDFYFAPKHPPVNDYHPPIVSQRPTNKDSFKWMLQPPPAAKVMEGKVPVSRSPSMASHLSRRTTASGGAELSRVVRERAMEAKLNSQEFPAEYEGVRIRGRPMSGRRNTNSSYGRASVHSTRARSLSMDSIDISADEMAVIRRRTTRTKVRQSVLANTDSSSDEENPFYLRSSDSFGQRRKSARRPNSQLAVVPPQLEMTQAESSSQPTVEGPKTAQLAPSPLLETSPNLASPPRPKSMVNSIPPIDEIPSQGRETPETGS